ncbi:MAG: DUF6807 family protein [Chloroflexota bacterium]
MSFVAKKHVSHNQFGYMIVDESTGQCLGGFGANYYRPWVFPLYTPNGLTVLQEFPYDHPFHTAMWVAQGPICHNGNESHFWPSPPMRIADEPLFENMGRMDVGDPEIIALEQGIRFRLNSIWRDKNGEAVLDEERTVELLSSNEGTVCNMWSKKTASYGALEYRQSKFGSVGVRVEPRLLPELGGVVLASDGRRGTAEVAIDQECTYVAYENSLPSGERFGLLMTILDRETEQAGIKTGPWFVRDYGLAAYNATRHESIYSNMGESWTIGLRVAAYDGSMNNHRADSIMAL